MNAPQIILLVLMAIGLLASAHMHGQPRKDKYSFWTSLISSAITIGLLIWGGFFSDK